MFFAYAFSSLYLSLHLMLNICPLTEITIICKNQPLNARKISLQNRVASTVLMGLLTGLRGVLEIGKVAVSEHGKHHSRCPASVGLWWAKISIGFSREGARHHSQYNRGRTTNAIQDHLLLAGPALTKRGF